MPQRNGEPPGSPASDLACNQQATRNGAALTPHSSELRQNRRVLSNEFPPRRPHVAGSTPN
jgi:hypothetical protein